MTTKKPGSVRTLGTLRAAVGKGIVGLEDRFDSDTDDLWSALTDTRRLARWLGEVEGDLRQGGEFHARYFASGWKGTGRVEVCEPPQRLLILTKSPDEPDGVIEATPTAEGNQTTPRLPTAGRRSPNSSAVVGPAQYGPGHDFG